MSTANEKQANPNADPNTVFGRELQTSLLAGLLAGGGLGGLGYLRNRMKRVQGPKPKPKPRYGFSLPAEFDDAASAAGYPTRGKEAMSDMARLLPLLGAGAGGLIGAVRARPGQKMKGILTGAAGGGLLGAAGTALQSDDVAQRLGRFIPSVADVKNYPGNDTASYGMARSPDPLHAGVRSFLNPALMIGGGLGGKALVDSMSKKDTRQRQEDAVADARREYFEALTGGQPDEQKKNQSSASKAASLDALYDKVVKKADEKGGLMSWLQSAGDAAHVGANTWGATAGLPAAALGTLGALYMYNKTKDNSAQKRFQIAQDAKRRLRPLQTPWIDPEELAAIKGVVEQKPETPRIYNG
jgi:hypothetical protein